MSEMEVPEGWKLTKLGDIGEYKYGYTAKSTSDNSGKPYLRITDINFDGSLKPGRVFVQISDDDFKRYGLKNNDIVIARTGATVGKSFLFNGGDDFIFASYLIRYRFDTKKIIPMFLYYVLQSPSFWKHIGISKVVGAQPNVNATKMSKFEFGLPNIKTQKKIVKKLDCILDEVNKKKFGIISTYEKIFGALFSSKQNFNLEKGISNLSNYTFNKIIHAAFEGSFSPDPNSFDYEKYKKVLNKFDKNKKTYTKRSYHENVVKSLHSSYNLPKKWTWIRFDSFSELISGQHILANDYNSTKKGIPYITGPVDFGNISPTITKWTEKPKVKAKKNDILITVKGAGVGKVNLLNIDVSAISRQLMAIRSDDVMPLLVYYYLSSQHHNLAKLAGDWTTVPGIGRESILQLEMPLIPQELQKETLDAIQEKLKKVLIIENKLKTIFSNYKNSIKTIEKMNYSVLDSAFSGKLVI
jgi:type I restriction enzyme, S subunit